MSHLLRIPAISTINEVLDDVLLPSVEGDEDDASAIPSTSDLVTVNLSVVYSPTYHVPALYFTAHRNSV